MERKSNVSRVVLKLWEAIKGADVDGIRDLLAQGCPTTKGELGGAHATHLALKSGNAEVVGVLIDAGVIEPSEFDSMLVEAVSQEKDAIALRLLTAGADPARYMPRLDGVNRTAFDVAIKRGARDLMFVITQHLTQEKKNHLLLMHAIEGNASGVRALLAAGADAKQVVQGAPLITMVPANSDAVKRMLRAIDTGAVGDGRRGR